MIYLSEEGHGAWPLLIPRSQFTTPENNNFWWTKETFSVLSPLWTVSTGHTDIKVN